MNKELINVRGLHGILGQKSDFKVVQVPTTVQPCHIKAFEYTLFSVNCEECTEQEQSPPADMPWKWIQAQRSVGLWPKVTFSNVILHK